MKIQQYRFQFLSLVLTFALVLSLSGIARSSTGTEGPFENLAQSLELKFRLMDLNEFDSTQFRQSLEKKSPLFTRLAWVEGRKVLEIVYARTFEGNGQKGLVVEIALPPGPWRNPRFGDRDLGKMISALLASLGGTLERELS